MLKSKIKVASIILTWALALPMFGQDLIASRAPIDRRLRATDSVSLQYLKVQERSEIVKNLYPEMSNRSVHHYPGVEVPDSFRIDLRHFAMPTPSRTVTSNYGYRKAFRRMHQGLDIKVYIGDTIVSAYDGVVRITNFERKGYGNYVVVRHNNGLETVYGHLSKHLVKEGQEVRAGEPIGLGGNTGRSYGSHLHFEVLFLGRAINPALLFDFPNQDIVSDYYTFYRDEDQCRTRLLAKNDDTGKEVEPTQHASAVTFHKVARGESLYSVARRYGISADKLAALNGLTTRSTIRVGQILRCPAQ